jgi:transcriptional regulator with XRE-family HTH domain
LVSQTNALDPTSLRLLLAALDQRQDYLARAAGIDTTQLSHYLAGRRPLSADQLKRLEMALLVLRLVDEAPPLSDEQIARIREVVAGKADRDAR